MKRMYWILAVVTYLLVSLNIPAQALTTVSPKGITVSPAIEQLSVQPHQNSVSFTSEITNNTAQSVNIMLSTNDFTALGQNGGISFYGSDYSSKANPHGLAYWLQPNINQFLLNPGKNQNVVTTINNINLMAQSGHYGALVYNVGKISLTNSHYQIDNNPVVSTLIFLSTAGEGTQTLHLSQPLISSLYLHPPESVQFVLTNVGNTQTTPRGYITEDQGKNELARGIINTGSGLVLPGSARLFSANLSTEASSFWGGTYRLTIFYRPDNASKYQTYVKNFFVIGPVWFWLLGLLILGLLTFVVAKQVYRQR